jgi:hypothetical protein
VCGALTYDWWLKPRAEPHRNPPNPQQTHMGPGLLLVQVRREAVSLPSSSLGRRMVSRPPLSPHLWAFQQRDRFPDPRPWTTTSGEYGGFEKLSSRSPWTPRERVFRLTSEAQNAHGVHPQLTSEGVGSFHASRGFRPQLRPRPASDCTIQMRNAAVREGASSSEVVGSHTGVGPRRDIVAGFSPHRRDSGSMPPSVRLGVRTAANVIGVHPPEPRLDMSHTARMKTEANFSRRFPSHRNAQGEDSAAAVALHDRLLVTAMGNRQPRMGDAMLPSVLLESTRRADGLGPPRKPLSPARPFPASSAGPVPPTTPPSTGPLAARTFLAIGTGSSAEARSRKLDF